MKKSIVIASMLLFAVPAMGFSPVVDNPVVAGGPANDNIADAEAILPVQIQMAWNNAGASLQAGELRPCGAIGSTVWYTFVASAPAAWEVNTFGVRRDSVLAAYTGSPGALTLKACNDDSPWSGYPFNSKITFTVAAGDTVYIQAGGYAGTQGDFVLNAFPAALGAALDPLLQA